MLFLEILGTILKIIGILLLSILLLLLFILLVFLFVPVRYRAKVVRNGRELSVQAQVSYIFRLIRLPVSFENGKLHMKLSVFGVTLFSNEEDGKGKKKRRKKKKGKAREEAKQGGEAEVSGKEAADTVNTADAADAPGQTLGGEPGEADGADGQVQALDAPPKEQAGENQDGTVCPAEAMGAQESKEGEAEKESGTSLIKRLISKAKALVEKILGILRSIKEKILSVWTKISDIKGMIKLVLEFLRDEENKNGIKYAGKSILRLLKHALPYKIEGDIVFATGDPYSMGRALSVLGMLYPLYAKKLSLSADFTAEHFRLDGRVQIKGRIRFGTVLWIAWKLWSKGKLKRLLSKAKELKHKLTTSAL